MSDYTDEDVAALKQPILDNFNPPDDHHGTWWINTDDMARAILDEMAPVLTARAKAEAYAEVAQTLRTRVDGQKGLGNARVELSALAKWADLSASAQMVLLNGMPPTVVRGDSD